MIAVGDKVQLVHYNFEPYNCEKSIVRVVLATQEIDGKLYASASGGTPCPCCGKYNGTRTPLILASLFRLVP